MSGEAVVTAAERYIGTPFHHQGRLPGVGLDCIGLVLCALREAGYQPPESSEAYGRAPKPTTMRRQLLRASRVLGADEPWRPGDALWLRIKRDPSHIALWTGHDLIHAYAQVGRVVRQPLDAQWRQCVESALRYRGLDVG
jgi:cell wall-associated NlpC family hydrolase